MELWPVGLRSFYSPVELPLSSQICCERTNKGCGWRAHQSGARRLLVMVIYRSGRSNGKQGLVVLHAVWYLSGNAKESGASVQTDNLHLSCGVGIDKSMLTEDESRHQSAAWIYYNTTIRSIQRQILRWPHIYVLEVRQIPLPPILLLGLLHHYH